MSWMTPVQPLTVTLPGVNPEEWVEDDTETDD
jgi:hypothetical protein